MRHGELENKINRVIEAVIRPDETYMDPSDANHALKRLIDEVSEYIMVIHRKTEGEGYIRTIRTAYYMSLKRKQRRYMKFKRLKPS